MSEPKSGAKLDLATKLSILDAEDDGLSVEEIAKKFLISHAVYVERVLKKRSELLQSPDVINLNKKRKRSAPPEKSREDLEDMEIDAEEHELVQSTPKKRQKGRKQNNLSVPGIIHEESASGSPNSLNQSLTVEELAAMTPSRRVTRRTPATTPVTKVQREPPVRRQQDTEKACMAAISTQDGVTSPFDWKTFGQIKDHSSQTTRKAYDEDYVKFLKETHEAQIHEKDNKIDALEKHIAKLNREKGSLQKELHNEKEKRVLEGGWKNNF